MLDVQGMLSHVAPEVVPTLVSEKAFNRLKKMGGQVSPVFYAICMEVERPGSDEVDFVALMHRQRANKFLAEYKNGPLSRHQNTLEKWLMEGPLPVAGFEIDTRLDDQESSMLFWPLLLKSENEISPPKEVLKERISYCLKIENRTLTTDEQRFLGQVLGCSKKITFQHFFNLQGRGLPHLRLVVITPPEEISMVLQRLNWQGNLEVLDHLLSIVIEAGMLTSMQLTFTSELTTKIGIEVYPPNVSEVLDARRRLEHFLKSLTVAKPLETGVMEALVAWPAREVINVASLDWPLQALRDLIVKVTLDDTQEISIKHYLSLTTFYTIV